jgi:novel plant SNARE
MKRIGNELDSVHFSLKKASQMVKEIGRQVLPRSLATQMFFFCYSYVAEFAKKNSFQVATDKCIMAFLFLIVCGVIAIIVVKVCCRLCEGVVVFILCLNKISYAWCLV